MELEDEVPPESVLKIVLCGDGASGKTSLCVRLAQDNFGRQYQQTVGLDFFSRRLLLPGNKSVLLQIWDIGGQSIASPMLEKYIYGADGALIVYDVTNSSSFENLEDWVNIINKYTKNQEKPLKLVLIGNKTDLEYRRAVRIEKHTKFAELHGMTSHYVSAKTGDSVILMFRQTACEILGVQMSKSDIEGDIIIVQAPVIAQSEAESRSVRQLRMGHSSIGTSVCRLS